jgi:hypothetical protein
VNDRLESGFHNRVDIKVQAHCSCNKSDHSFLQSLQPVLQRVTSIRACVLLFIKAVRTCSVVVTVIESSRHQWWPLVGGDHTLRMMVGEVVECLERRPWTELSPVKILVRKNHIKSSQRPSFTMLHREGSLVGYIGVPTRATVILRVYSQQIITAMQSKRVVLWSW